MGPCRAPGRWALGGHGKEPTAGPCLATPSSWALGCAGLPGPVGRGSWAEAASGLAPGLTLWDGRSQGGRSLSGREGQETGHTGAHVKSCRGAGRDQSGPSGWKGQECHSLSQERAVSREGATHFPEGRGTLTRTRGFWHAWWKGPRAAGIAARVPGKQARVQGTGPSQQRPPGQSQESASAGKCKPPGGRGVPPGDPQLLFGRTLVRAGGGGTWKC